MRFMGFYLSGFVLEYFEFTSLSSVKGTLSRVINMVRKCYFVFVKNDVLTGVAWFLFWSHSVVHILLDCLNETI